MKPYPPDPLSPEERELAQLTARLGLQGEPSPALDARVLAAAHAALQPARTARRKPRWPVALGLAASMVLAVGIAWQLRPLQSPPVIVAAEAPAPTPSPAEVQTQSPPAAAPASEEAEMAAMAKVAEPPAAAISTEAVAKPAPRPATPAPAPALADRGNALPGNARARSEQRASQPATTVDSAVVTQTRMADQYQPPAPPAPPAPAAMPAPASAETPAAQFVPSPMEEPTPHRESADANTSAFAGTARVAHSRPAAAREAAAKASAASAQARESETLDRVEVSGSRLKRTDLQVPVSDDARLPVNEWLERVRTRYGLGDAGAAKKSLLLFVKDHPRETVPDDLEPLLEK